MRPLLLLAALLSPVAACSQASDAANPYGDPDTVWHLDGIDGAPFDARANLTFPSEGEFGGAAPCNTYGGTNSAAYPEFSAGPMRVTRRACPEMDAETLFLNALPAMRLAERNGTTLILRSGDGREMTFTAGE